MSDLIIPDTKVVPATLDDLKYITSLARKETHSIGFIPNTTYEKIIEDQRATETIYMYYENGDPVGFCYAAHNQQGVMRVHQICVQNDARRETRATELVMESVLPRDMSVVLKCAEDLDANEFWRAIGFEKVNTLPANNARKREIHVYHKQLGGLFNVRTGGDFTADG